MKGQLALATMMVAALAGAAAALPGTAGASTPPGGNAALPRGGAAAMPRLDWRGAERVIVVCNARSETPDTSLRLRDTLCTAIAANAAGGLPVSIARFGDAAMFDARSVVLLVNAASRPDSAGPAGADRRIVSFAVRPWRAIHGEENDLFGAAPHAVHTAADDRGPELDAAIATALDSLLPWRQRA